MTTTHLALIEMAVVPACFAAALLASRRLLAPAPTLGRSLGAVIIWTGFSGSTPYLVFLASHRLVVPPTSGMGLFASLVLGSLPLWMLVSPFIGLYMVLKRLSRYMADSRRSPSLGDIQSPHLP